MTERALDALRSAAPDAYFVLDDDDRITPRLDGPSTTTRGRWLGHVFWDHLPRAREVYGPHFDEARATGQSGRVDRSSTRGE